MNPNMMNPMMMGNQNIKEPKELWKEEKSKYRHWIILFGIAITTLFIIVLVGLILNVVYQKDVKDSLFQWSMKNNSTKGTQTIDAVSLSFSNDYYRTSLIAIGIAKVAFFGIGMTLYVTTIIDSYKKRTFSNISKWSTGIIGLGAFMGVYQLISLFSKNPLFSYKFGIYNFAEYLIAIITYLFVSIPINKIRRAFLVSESYNAMKNSPEYQAYQQQMKQYMQNNGQMNNPMMGPFGPMAAQPQPQNQQTNEAKEKEIDSTKKFNDTERKLNSMKISELKQIAKKLSISGHKIMKKSELINAIKRASEK